MNNLELGGQMRYSPTRHQFATAVVSVSVLLILGACEPRKGGSSEQRHRPAFSLEGFPEEMRELQASARRAGAPRLDEFTPPALVATPLEQSSKREFLNRFLDSRAAAFTNDSGTRRRVGGSDPAFTLQGFEQLRDLQTGEYTIEDYAKEVATELGPIPSFNVFEKGVILPITLNDVEIPAGQHSPTGLCDRPALLGLGGDGQCVPYSRIGRLPGTNPQTGQADPNILWVFIARRYKIRTNPNDPTFEDIAIVGHNRLTGATAFFQMLDETTGKSGIRVPSPMEKPADTPAGFPTAQEFWLPPSQTAAIGCNRCHDSDPFVHSPYVNQASMVSPGGINIPVVPSDAKGHYRFIGTKAFTSWTAPQQFKPTGNECTTCHRIGVSASSDVFSRWATGDPPRQLSATFGSYPNSHWMPPGEAESMTKADWDAQYRQSVLQLLSCHQDPAQAACKLQPMP